MTIPSLHSLMAFHLIACDNDSSFARYQIDNRSSVGLFSSFCFGVADSCIKFAVNYGRSAVDAATNAA